MDEALKESFANLEKSFIYLIQAYVALANQYVEDVHAIEHELEIMWEAINELQGIDPAKAGEPDGH